MTHIRANASNLFKGEYHIKWDRENGSYVKKTNKANNAQSSQV